MVMTSNDLRVQEVIKLLSFAPVQASDLLLDIGVGAGEISATLARRVRRVIGTGLSYATYGTRAADLAARGVQAVECVCEALPFPEQQFDVVVMSHILEHTPNVAWALGAVRRVLKPSGWLCVLVPPSSPLVEGGHIAVGWNIGQLMYVLALNDFDVQHGHFVKGRYSVCGFARRDDRPLPLLRHDFGDLLALAADQRWPLPIVNQDPAVEAFDGDLQAVHWPWVEVLPSHRGGAGGRLLRRLVPAVLKPRISRLLHRVAQALVDDPDRRQTAMVNPKTLGR